MFLRKVVILRVPLASAIVLKLKKEGLESQHLKQEMARVG
jgi:hypothetical protein